MDGSFTTQKAIIINSSILKKGKVTVPHPKKDIAIDTLRNIFRQAGWDWRQE